MKKTLAILLALTMVLGLFSGCASTPAAAEPAAVSEVVPDLPLAVADHDHEPVEAGPDCRRNQVFENRTVCDRQHHLRPRGRERAHPLALARGEDHALHHRTASRRYAAECPGRAGTIWDGGARPRATPAWPPNGANVVDPPVPWFMPEAYVLTRYEAS